MQGCPGDPREQPHWVAQRHSDIRFPWRLGYCNKWRSLKRVGGLGGVSIVGRVVVKQMGWSFLGCTLRYS